MDAVPVLLIGDIERPEFEPALAALTGATRAADIERAIARLAAGGIEPAVIVLAQSLPGSIAADDVERLRRAAPLARIVGLLGAWCEGETRTGAPWPTVARYYGHQAASRLAGDLRTLRDGGCPAWGLPATISEDERILAAVSARAGDDSTSQHGAVVIRSNARETSDWLMASCHAIGYHTTGTTEKGVVPGAVAGIWDGRLDAAEDADDIARLARAIAPAPVVALLGFPRAEQRKWALAAGAATVLSKPCLLSELEAALHRPAGQRA